jgi:hypothetical protein
MSLVMENVYDDLVDPEENGSFVEYHLEGNALVAEDLVNGGRYLVDVRLHKLEDEDFMEPNVYAFHRGSVVSYLIINNPQAKRVRRRRWEQNWHKGKAE